ncbi:hypothetical protein [Limosilactobacillus antri]|uniref:hypothetical protein n=1 Tax=Limosilactobacillus antri TaxID=227943 RepID=UPI001F5709C3|nr:hypothetical protein [Limosilactobacillus antri]
MRTRQEIQRIYRNIKKDLASSSFDIDLSSNTAVIYDEGIFVCNVWLTKDDCQVNISKHIMSIPRLGGFDVSLTGFLYLMTVLYDNIEGEKAVNEHF